MAVQAAPLGPSFPLLLFSQQSVQPTVKRSMGGEIDVTQHGHYREPDGRNKPVMRLQSFLVQDLGILWTWVPMDPGNPWSAGRPAVVVSIPS